MDESLAKNLIESQGYEVEDIKFIPEGRNHFCFDVLLKDGSSTIARFERDNIDGKKRDFHYNGFLSLERERNLCNILREEAKLPAPKINGLYGISKDSFLLVEKLPGKSWKEYIQEKNYQLGPFLKSLEFLGEDLAQVQRINFESYGDVIDRNFIQPYGIYNFTDRLKTITNLKLQRAKKSNVLTMPELSEVDKYFRQNFDFIDKKLQFHEEKPVLILTDIHPMNFLVDMNGKPSGYPDLEWCQSGIPSLEFYILKYGLFNYFDNDTFDKAEDAFFRGFRNNGGVYERDDPINLALEKTLSVGHLLAAVTAYNGASDGLRDTWGGQFKEIMFHAIKENHVDYVAIADVLRSKTKQPRNPNYSTT